MVRLHLPKAREIFKDGSVEDWKKYPLYFMFIRGHYSDVFALDEMFGKKFILIDGELFKTKPWIALGQIEKSLGMKS